jgi:diguanylate cyclase (GGDEF)-like protein
VDLQLPEQRLLLGRLLALAIAAGGSAFATLELFPDSVAAGVGMIAFFVAGVAAALFLSTTTSNARAPEPGAETPRSIDLETGLGNQHQFAELLRREVARHHRYGRRCSVGIVQSEVVGWRPDALGGLPPSTAKHVVDVLFEAVRESDAVFRIDHDRFAVLLPECELPGAQRLLERVKNALSAGPFTRNEDGTGVYLRAWGGAVEVQDEESDPLAYLRAAIADTDLNRPRKEGEGVLLLHPALRAHPNRGIKANRTA